MAKPLSLVTGACGFMGTHMVEVLAEAGHRVRATDLESACAKDDRHRGRFPSVLRRLGVEIVPSDMTRPETLAPLCEGVDYVFHIAAVFSYSAPRDLLYKVNVEGTRALLDLLAGRPGLKRLVVWGAGGVYGYPTPAMLPLREELPVNPPNNYLASKAEQERLVMEYGRERGLPYAIIRPTTVYGPRAVYGGGQIFFSVARMKVVAAPRNLDGRVPLVHVRDVCRAALHLAEHPGAAGHIYNVNDDSQWTTVELMRYLARLLGKPFVALPPVPVSLFRRALVAAARLEGLVARYVTRKAPNLEEDSVQYLGRDFTYSNEKLKSTGFRFEVPDPAVGLRDTLEWYRKEGWL
jgi:nucleoside-diphosphate-sugar epimerase